MCSAKIKNKSCQVLHQTWFQSRHYRSASYNPTGLSALVLHFDRTFNVYVKYKKLQLVRTYLYHTTSMIFFTIRWIEDHSSIILWIFSPEHRVCSDSLFCLTLGDFQFYSAATRTDNIRFIEETNSITQNARFCTWDIWSTDLFLFGKSAKFERHSKIFLPSKNIVHK